MATRRPKAGSEAPADESEEKRDTTPIRLDKELVRLAKVIGAAHGFHDPNRWIEHALWPIISREIEALPQTLRDAGRVRK